MRKRRVVLLLLLIFTSLHSELIKEKPARQNSKPLLGLGLGLLMQVSMHSEFNHNYMCLRHYSIGIPNGETYIQETAILYGRTYNLNTGLKCYIAFSGGFGYNTSLYNRDKYDTIEKKSTRRIAEFINKVQDERFRYEEYLGDYKMINELYE